jgi:hypothetical protein
MEKYLKLVHLLNSTLNAFVLKVEGFFTRTS